MLWVDLLAQQALVAYSIVQLSKFIENSTIQEEYLKKYDQLKTLLNTKYWSTEDGFYYDITLKPPNKKLVVRTPASYWSMLAMVCDQSQAEKMREKALDPKWFGGPVPWPSLARNDKAFSPTGSYWRGGIWIPTSYMCTKALERYGFYELADQLAYQTVLHMQQTYEKYDPHTIWEAYSPTEFRPATHTNGTRIVKPDFCGWSGIGPITLFIENILGFHHVDGINKQIAWRIHQQGRHGIEGLNFGGITTDIVYDSGIVSVKSDLPYQLKVNDQLFEIQPGTQEFTL
jgi:glycogen debranching enzyme